MITAFQSLRVRHPGLCDQMEKLLGQKLDTFNAWRDVYSAISRRDVINHFQELRGSSTERTLAAAIMIRCDYARQADDMLDGRAMGRIADLDRDQLKILHEILAH